MSKVILALCMVIAILVVPTSALLLCPFGNDPQNLVPCCQISAENTFTGTTNGIMMVSQDSTSRMSSNSTQIVGSSLYYQGLTGLHDISLQSTTTNKQIGVTAYDVQDIKYNGMGSTLKTTSYGMEVGSVTAPNPCASCNLAYSGATVDMTNGQYSAVQDTSVLGHLSSQYAMTANGDGMISVFSNSYSHKQQLVDSNNETPISGAHTQSFWSTLIGNYSTSYVYNYKAGI